MILFLLLNCFLLPLTGTVKTTEGAFVEPLHDLRAWIQTLYVPLPQVRDLIHLPRMGILANLTHGACTNITIALFDILPESGPHPLDWFSMRINGEISHAECFGNLRVHMNEEHGDVSMSLQFKSSVSILLNLTNTWLECSNCSASNVVTDSFLSFTTHTLSNEDEHLTNFVVPTKMSISCEPEQRMNEKSSSSSSSSTCFQTFVSEMEFGGVPQVWDMYSCLNAPELQSVLKNMTAEVIDTSYENTLAWAIDEANKAMSGWPALLRNVTSAPVQKPAPSIPEGMIIDWAKNYGFQFLFAVLTDVMRINNALEMVAVIREVMGHKPLMAIVKFLRFHLFSDALHIALDDVYIIPSISKEPLPGERHLEFVKKTTNDDGGNTRHGTDGGKWKIHGRNNKKGSDDKNGKWWDKKIIDVLLGPHSVFGLDVFFDSEFSLKIVTNLTMMMVANKVDTPKQEDHDNFYDHHSGRRKKRGTMHSFTTANPMLKESISSICLIHIEPEDDGRFHEHHGTNKGKRTVGKDTRKDHWRVENAPMRSLIPPTRFYPRYNPIRKVMKKRRRLHGHEAPLQTRRGPYVNVRHLEKGRNHLLMALQHAQTALKRNNVRNLRHENVSLTIDVGQGFALALRLALGVMEKSFHHLPTDQQLCPPCFARTIYNQTNTPLLAGLEVLLASLRVSLEKVSLYQPYQSIASLEYSLFTDFNILITSLLAVYGHPTIVLVVRKLVNDYATNGLNLFLHHAMVEYKDKHPCPASTYTSGERATHPVAPYILVTTLILLFLLACAAGLLMVLFFGYSVLGNRSPLSNLRRSRYLNTTIIIRRRRRRCTHDLSIEHLRQDGKQQSAYVRWFIESPMCIQYDVFSESAAPSWIVSGPTGIRAHAGLHARLQTLQVSPSLLPCAPYVSTALATAADATPIKPGTTVDIDTDMFTRRKSDHEHENHGGDLKRCEMNKNKMDPEVNSMDGSSVTDELTCECGVWGEDAGSRGCVLVGYEESLKKMESQNKISSVSVSLGLIACRGLKGWFYGAIFILILNSLFFLFAQTTPIASVKIRLQDDPEGFDVFVFSLTNLVAKINNNYHPYLAVLIVLFSGAWPHVMLGLVGIIWTVPMNKMPFRGTLIDICNANGKMSLVLLYGILFFAVGANVQWNGTHGRLWIKTEALPGFYIFLGATMSSQLAAHFLLYHHRASAFAAFSSYISHDALTLCTMRAVRANVGLHSQFLIVCCMLLSIIFLLFGCFTNGFIFSFGGLTGSFLDLAYFFSDSPEPHVYSLWTFVMAIRHEVSMVTGVFVFMISSLLVMPCVFLASLVFLWVRPLNPEQRNKAFVVAQICRAWHCLDIFPLIAIVSLVFVPMIVNFVVLDGSLGPLCALIGWVQQEGSKLASAPTHAQSCLLIEPTIGAGLYVLLLASFFFVAASHGVFYVCKLGLYEEA